MAGGYFNVCTKRIARPKEAQPGSALARFMRTAQGSGEMISWYYHFLS